MTKKDYIKVADILASELRFARHSTGYTQRDKICVENSIFSVAQALGGYFSNDDKRFNNDKFINYLREQAEL